MLIISPKGKQQRERYREPDWLLVRLAYIGAHRPDWLPVRLAYVGARLAEMNAAYGSTIATAGDPLRRRD